MSVIAEVVRFTNYESAVPSCCGGAPMLPPKPNMITLTAPSTRPIRLLAFALAVAPALAEPDEDALGKAQGYPRGTPATMFADSFKVGSFSAADQILPMRSGSRRSA